MSGQTFDPLVPADAAWRGAMTWLAGLGVLMPSPDLAVGDDGSVVLEWDVDGRVLHIGFDPDGVGEAYFHDPAKGFTSTVQDVVSPESFPTVRMLAGVAVTGLF